MHSAVCVRVSRAVYSQHPSSTNW